MKISHTMLMNRESHSHQLFLASKCEWGLPKLQSRRCYHPHGDCWGAGGMQEARWTRKQDLAPGSWSAYEGNEFSEPRGLHLPIHRILTSLTWYLIFDVQTAGSLGGKLVHSLTSPLASLEQLSQSHWDAISWAQASWTFPPKKTALFSDCDFIF